MTDFCYPILNDEVNLPFYVAGIGSIDTEWHVKRDEGYVHNQLIYCVRGQGKLIVDGEEYDIEPGHGFYLPKGVPHEYYATQDIWENHWVSFDGSAVEEFMKTIQFENARVFEITNVHSVEVVFKKMLSILKTNSFFCSYDCSSMLYKFLLEIHRYVNIQSSLVENYKILQLQPVIDFIEENYTKEIELKELADIVGLSSQYVCRLFKECFNLRPFEYISRRRIQEAKTLLVEASYNINEIAKRVGFKDCSYFCAVFKRNELVSPMEFRHLHRRNIVRHIPD